MAQIQDKTLPLGSTVGAGILYDLLQSSMQKYLIKDYQAKKVT